MKITNEKELGEALKNGEDYIEIEGDLSERIIKIKATGEVAWGIVFATAIVVPVVAILAIPATGGKSTTLSTHSIVASSFVPASILGAEAVACAIAIAVAAGSVFILNKLRRKYRMERVSDSRIILSKK